MRYSEPLFWKHGIFLQPHHFQYADAYQHNSLWQQAQLGLTHPWGLVRCDINEEKLRQNLIGFNALDLVFEDGARVNIEHNAVIANFRFDAARVSGRQSGYKIYIGIRKITEGQPNVTLIDQSSDLTKIKTRFISLINDTARHNLYEGGETAYSETLKYVVHVFGEEEVKNAQGFHLIPVLQLNKQENQIVLDQYFIPPLIASAGYKYFTKYIDTIYHLIHDQTSQFEIYKFESFMQDAYEGHHQRESRLTSGYRLSLQTLARYLMECAAYKQSNNVHPWYFYKLFSQMIGELSLFSARIDASGKATDNQTESLQPYDHYNLQKTFGSIKSLVEMLLADISLQPEMFIEMKFDGTSRFGVMIPDNFFNLDQEFYLGLVTKEPVQQWLSDFIHFAKIASESAVKELSLHALPGLQVMHMHERPQGIPARPDTTYFKLVRNGYAWETIQKTRSLVVLWDKKPADCQMHLSVIKE